jgi:hypothetical protein
MGCKFSSAVHPHGPPIDDDQPISKGHFDVERVIGQGGFGKVSSRHPVDGGVLHPVGTPRHPCVTVEPAPAGPMGLHHGWSLWFNGRVILAWQLPGLFPLPSAIEGCPVVTVAA